MGVLSFILGMFAITVGAFVTIGIVGTVYNYDTLKKENKRLKEKIKEGK